MKTFRILALVSLCAALLSCEKPITGLQLDKTSLSFASDGGTQTIELKAGTAWTITSEDESWCTVSPKSGDASASVNVTALPNSRKDLERSTTLTVSYDGKTLPVTVSQEKNPAEPVFSISQKSFDLGYDSAEISFTVISDVVEYDITLVDSWISLASRTGDRFSGETLTFNVAGNDLAEARTGVVSICTKDGSCIPVTVKQAAFEGDYFTRLHIGYRFTATWCGWCPYMDAAYQQARKEDAAFDFVTFHASAGYPLYFEDSGTFAAAYQIDSYPSGVLDGWKAISNNTNLNSAAKRIHQLCADFDKKFPCVSSVSASAAYADGGVAVEAEFETAISGEYLFHVILLESGIVQEQTYFTEESSETIKDFVHDNVARKTVTESVSGDTFTASSKQLMTFRWSTVVDESWNKKNLSVAVLVFRPYGAHADDKAVKKYPDYYLDNAAVVAVGDALETTYAE